MSTAIIHHHHLLSLLLSRWETARGRIGPGQHVRLQRLWAALPLSISTDELKHCLCAIFAIDALQQDHFHLLFEQLTRELGIVETPSHESISGISKAADTPKTEEDIHPANRSAVNSEIKPSPLTENRPLVVELDECIAPPFTWNIVPVEPGQLMEIHPGENFGRTALRLRRRELAGGAMLDIPATIRASIGRAGLPEFRFGQRTRPPEYLLLVERFSQNDHRAGLFDFFFHSLRSNEVFVERFFYDGDLRICRNERFPTGLNLPELRYWYPNARLLILGAGYRFISSRTGQLADWMTTLLDWQVRVLLTPVPRDDWGHRENLLAQVFTLLPASVQSLHYVAESPEGTAVQYEALPDYIRRIAEVRPIVLEAPIVRSLSRHFDPDLLTWIAACAVYPALHYALTLHLGRLLSTLGDRDLVTAENLLALARLPWFTDGKIPAAYRDELLGYLEHRQPQQHLAILQNLHELMENNPPPEKSVAWAEHQINLALLKMKMEVEPDEETLRQLRPVVSRLNRPEKRGDFVLPEQWKAMLEQLDILEGENSDNPEKIEQEFMSIIEKTNPNQEKIASSLLVTDFANNQSINSTSDVPYVAQPAAVLTLQLFTPNDDNRPVFLTGNFNDWTTCDDRYQMEKISTGNYRYTFLTPIELSEPLEYKYMKGGWESEELGNDGQSSTTRRMEIPHGQVSDIVPRWKMYDAGYDPEFYPSIKILTKRFNAPQLRRRRRISILLPWNYHVTTRHYPVLYLQDGQNLFEEHAPFGTWGVDKQLATLAQRGQGNFIVVAIDHGGKERIREFSPYDSRWGQGLGRSYAQFMVESLKPYIDQKFRTLSDRANTGIGGSSMGGLISIYAGFIFPEVFSKFMIFSPSLWISNRIYTEPVRFSSLETTKIYLYTGGKEGANMPRNAERFQDMMVKLGYSADKLQLNLVVDPQGRHNEERWGQEFPKAAEWLFN